MLDAIYGAIGKFLGWLDSFSGSYIVALFIFAILVEILMLPLGIKQHKNSIKQAKLRPKEMAIRNKYKGRNDKVTQQKITEEIQELYTREGYNPAGGCLPLLIQLPIIIILYNVVINPLQYVVGMSSDVIANISAFASAGTDVGGLGLGLKSSRGTIELLSTMGEKGLSYFEGIKTFAFENGANGEELWGALSDAFAKGLPNFNLFGLNLGYVPSITSPSWLWLIPILTFAVYFGSMKLTRKFTYQPTMAANDAQAGCSNNIMDITMPLMSVYISFIVPAAIGVYWIFKSLLSTLKQFIISRVMPFPKFTEEDYKAAEKELKGRTASKPARPESTSGTKPRSLHHIDDDDEDTPAPVNGHKGTRFDVDEEESEKTESNKDSKNGSEKTDEKPSIISKAPLKSDDKSGEDSNNESSKEA